MMQKYNPDLQRRSLENRAKTQEDFDKFVSNLREYSKSDKPSACSIDCSNDLDVILANFPLYSMGSAEGRREEAGRCAKTTDRSREPVHS